MSTFNKVVEDRSIANVESNRDVWERVLRALEAKGWDFIIVTKCSSHGKNEQQDPQITLWNKKADELAVKGAGRRAVPVAMRLKYKKAAEETRLVHTMTVDILAHRDDVLMLAGEVLRQDAVAASSGVRHHKESGRGKGGGACAGGSSR